MCKLVPAMSKPPLQCLQGRGLSTVDQTYKQTVVCSHEQQATKYPLETGNAQLEHGIQDTAHGLLGQHHRSGTLQDHEGGLRSEVDPSRIKAPFHLDHSLHCSTLVLLLKSIFKVSPPGKAL
ncbi:hypothetical protein ABBQ32_002006 [Trebouxia sp. C0010 RCD-2024]